MRAIQRLGAPCFGESVLDWVRREVFGDRAEPWKSIEFSVRRVGFGRGVGLAGQVLRIVAKFLLGGMGLGRMEH